MADADLGGCRDWRLELVAIRDGSDLAAFECLTYYDCSVAGPLDSGSFLGPTQALAVRAGSLESLI
jgi:hypothetical protein